MSDRGPLQVAVGVLRNAAGEVFLAQRPSGTHLAGSWEFPGGKREPGESRWAALVRELEEEIGVQVEAAHPLIRLTHTYAERTVELDVWEVTHWAGEARANEGQPVEWVAVEALAERAMPAADRPIITALGLPEYYAISPELEPTGAHEFLGAFERTLRAGVRLIQLRRKGEVNGTGQLEALDALIREAVSKARAFQARVLLNLPTSVPESHRRTWLELADGMHLPGHRLGDGRAAPEGLVGVSCHRLEELTRAAEQGADFAVLSPVQPTTSHPDATPLGWQKFDEMVRPAPLPVYALGGLVADDLAQARACGAQGIAAITGLWKSRAPE